MSDEELEELIGGLIFVGIIAGFFVFLFETSMLNAILELTMDEHISRFPGGDLYALIYLFIYFSIYGFIVWWFCESPEDLLYILSPVFVGSYLLIVLLGTEDFCIFTVIMNLIFPCWSDRISKGISDLIQMRKKKKERYEKLKAKLIEEMDRFLGEDK